MLCIMYLYSMDMKNDNYIYMHIAYVVTYGLLHHTCDIRLKSLVTVTEEVEAHTGSPSCPWSRSPWRGVGFSV